MDLLAEYLDIVMLFLFYICLLCFLLIKPKCLIKFDFKSISYNRF